jgi:hypothetical protein
MISRALQSAQDASSRTAYRQVRHDRQNHCDNQNLSRVHPSKNDQFVYHIQHDCDDEQVPHILPAMLNQFAALGRVRAPVVLGMLDRTGVAGRIAYLVGERPSAEFVDLISLQRS